MRALLVLLSILGLQRAPPQSGDVAVVVNVGNLTSALSSNELVSVFKQQTQHWKNGERIYLVMQEAGAEPKRIVLRRVYKMKTDEELKKFWLEALFRGDIASFPKTLSSDEAVILFVRQVPNAIGFVDASVVDKTVKVLRVDQHLPGEQGYFLAASPR